MKDTARVLGRMFDGIEYRGFGQDTVEDARRLRRRAGLERAHRRVAPDPDALRHAHHARALPTSTTTRSPSPTCGDARNNVGNSLLVTGAMMGMDVRIVAPRSLWNHRRRSSTQARGDRRARPAPGSRTPTTSPRASRGVDFVYTDVWVSMGEPKEVWDERIDAAAALPGQRCDVLTRDRQPAT